MRVALLFGIFPLNIRNDIISNVNGIVENAANNLQIKIIEGIRSDITELKIFNFPFVGYFPTSYRSIKTPEGKVSYQLSDTSDEIFIPGYSYSYNTVFGLKSLSIEKIVRKRLKEWLKNGTNRTNVIVIYSFNISFLKACRQLKKSGLRFKVVLIVPDLPKYMGRSRWFLRRLYINLTEPKRIHDQLTIINDCVDSYIFLTKYMANYLHQEQKKSIVIEGIASNLDEQCEKNIDSANLNETILYTGTLDYRYGIANLLDAFDLIMHKETELYICGAGEAADEIFRRSNRNPRIKFLGQLPSQRVMELQSAATILVNPRTSDGEFTKYSFPSKTMEYMVSGNPTILNRLPGVPEEYYKYSFQPKDESVESLAQIIDEVLDMSFEERKAFGLAARDFILSNKSIKVQGKRIVNLLRTLKED